MRNLNTKLAGLLVALLLLALLPTAAFAADSSPIPTRDEVCTILLDAAQDYHPGVAKTDILKGDEGGNLQETRAVTRAEALIMLSRAFGTLPTPVGAYASSAFPAQDFSDVPAWAATELANVFQAGIVGGNAAGLLDPNTPITLDELDRLIRRVYALEGSNLKDNFYATINKTALENSTIPDGKMMSGNYSELGYKVEAEVAALITEIAAKAHKKGSGEQKIADLYHNALNWEARDKVGIAPLTPFLDAIDGAKTIGELMAVDAKIFKELGISLLMCFGLSYDAKDSTQYTVSLASFSPSVVSEVYADAEGTQAVAYRKYMETIMALGGASEAESAAAASLVFKLEAPLAAATLAPQDLHNVEKTYNMMPMKDLKALFPNVDLDALYTSSGLKQVDQILVCDLGLLQAVAALFDQAHLEELKTVAHLGLLQSCGGMLSRAFTDANNTFDQEYLGVQGTASDTEVAAAEVQSLMSTYLGKAYVEKYFSPEAKADVVDMATELIAIFKERIEALDWMNDTTKKMAIKKLDTMGIKVGYHDVWNDKMDAVTIHSAADGGSYFQNMVAIRTSFRDQTIAKQSTPIDKNQWGLPLFTINASYTFADNAITFPAAILQAPIYDVNAPRAQNLGTIGNMIAHEITHAFDNQGAQYDELGNARDWWTAEDYAAFQALCDDVVAFYDGKECAPGISCNGALTLSENIADLGAVACVTEAVSREKTPDYETLYQSMTRNWRFIASRKYLQDYVQTNVHAPATLRGNLPMQTCDAFFTTFDIQAGDGMYVAPEVRVSIW